MKTRIATTLVASLLLVPSARNYDADEVLVAEWVIFKMDSDKILEPLKGAVGTLKIDPVTDMASVERAALQIENWLRRFQVKVNRAREELVAMRSAYHTEPVRRSLKSFDDRLGEFDRELGKRFLLFEEKSAIDAMTAFDTDALLAPITAMNAVLESEMTAVVEAAKRILADSKR